MLFQWDFNHKDRISKSACADINKMNFFYTAPLIIMEN